MTYPSAQSSGIYEHTHTYSDELDMEDISEDDANFFRASFDLPARATFNANTNHNSNNMRTILLTMLIGFGTLCIMSFIVISLLSSGGMVSTGDDSMSISYDDKSGDSSNSQPVEPLFSPFTKEDFLNRYEKWKKYYITNEGASVGLRVRIRESDDATLSEGMGYGMILAVHANDKETFHGLLKYVKHFGLNLDRRRVESGEYFCMSYRISSNSEVEDSRCSSDADQDMAYALLVAHRKWGEEGQKEKEKKNREYIDLAQAIMNTIWDHELLKNEVNDTFLLQQHNIADNKGNNNHVGDAVLKQQCTNPSSYSPAIFELFEYYDAHERAWQAVITSYFRMMLKVNNRGTGLAPDWCTVDGSASSSPYCDSYSYSWEAVRYPYRIAQDAIWNKRQISRRICDQINAHFMKIGVEHIGPSTVDGAQSWAPGQPVFLYTAAACAVLSKDEDYRSSLFDAILRDQTELYYQDAFQLLSFLLVSNLADSAGSVERNEEALQQQDDQQQPKQATRRNKVVVIISLDGFRYTYLDDMAKNLSKSFPALAELTSKGSLAPLRPIFPSKTYPNHYTQATGLYAESHGIVANYFMEPDYGSFALGHKSSEDPHWWLGEPMWVTPLHHNLTSACYFWPGSDVKIGGYRPTFYYPYEEETPYEDRVLQSLRWMHMNYKNRPSLVTLYFEATDTTGHQTGPNNKAAIKEAMAQDDRALQILLDGIDEMDLMMSPYSFPDLDVIVVSDHGMAELSSERQIVFTSEVCELLMNTSMVITWSPVLQVRPYDHISDETVERLYQQLKEYDTWLTVMKKSEVPERFHYSHSPRIAPILGLVEIEWTLVPCAQVTERDRELFKRRSRREQVTGTHGFDPMNEEMIGIFIAKGSSFKSKKRIGSRKSFLDDSIESVHIYSLLMHLLQIPPAPNNGTYEMFQEVLN